MSALSAAEECLRVLDPMSGSGTVLAVARSMGHRAYGVDIDPLAVLLADVWTRPIEPELVLRKAEEVLERARGRVKARECGTYPTKADAETRAFLRYWFDDYARRQLCALSQSISRVHEPNTRNALWCGFSRLIISKSSGASLAMDLSHSRPHKTFATAPVKPFNGFIRAVEGVVSNCPLRQDGAVGPATIVKLADARELPFSSSSFDLVLTSPPYLNAIDYMRCSKFSLVWMGYNLAALRRIRGESVGAESFSKEAFEAPWARSIVTGLDLRPTLSVRDHALLVRYVWDMGWSLSESSRVLREGGRAVYVVGDSTVRGTYIANSMIVEAVAEQHGLRLVKKRSRALPPNRRYMPCPTMTSDNALSTRMRREVVLTFVK